MPATEPTLTIDACGGRMRPIPYLQHRNVPRALTANTRSHSSSEVSGVVVVATVPAELTSTCSSGPNAAPSCSNIAITDASSATSTAA